MKKLSIMLLWLTICGCTTQAPVSQAPVYNVTVTDNSQYVVGDNNKAEAKPTVRAEQVAQPNVSAEATKKGPEWFMFWAGFIIGIALCLGGYFIYIKYFKRRFDK